MSASISRIERFANVASTQDVVRDWLRDGVAEVCLAVADTQAQGRGRLARRWVAPPGRALLVSAGFRPGELPLEAAWRLPATVCLAMRAAAAELLPPEVAPMAVKWPNDLVVLESSAMRKLGGVLAEGTPEGDRLATAVVGIGVNVDWPASRFPPELAATMGSLSEAGGRSVDRDALLRAWTRQLEPRYAALLAGRFDTAEWSAAQATTGAEVEVDTGGATLRGTAIGVDEASGALLLHVTGEPAPRAIAHGDVTRCRVRPPAGSL